MIAGGPIAGAAIAQIYEAGLPTINAELSVTLDAVTLTATLEITGELYSASITLDDISLLATAAVDIAAALTVTLDDITSTATGEIDIAAEVTAFLDDFICAATLDNTFRYVRQQATLGQITTTPTALPGTILTAQSVTKLSQITTNRSTY